MNSELRCTHHGFQYILHQNCSLWEILVTHLSARSAKTDAVPPLHIPSEVLSWNVVITFTLFSDIRGGSVWIGNGWLQSLHSITNEVFGATTRNSIPDIYWHWYSTSRYNSTGILSTCPILTSGLPDGGDGLLAPSRSEEIISILQVNVFLFL